MTEENLFLKDIIKTSSDIWKKGWAERNAGNISVRLKCDEINGSAGFDFTGPWTKLNTSYPNLGNEFFLVTGTGKYIRNIEIAPEDNLGILQLNEKGEQYRVVWGYEDGARPTSELPAHLAAHSIRKSVSSGKDRVVLHTHPTDIIALTYARHLDTVSLTGLLWEMHGECIVVFPEGVEYLPWMMAGSEQIAKATAQAFYMRNLVVWEYHGVFASGPDLDTAFGLVDTAEKAAGIYIKAASMGGVIKKLPLNKLVSIANNYGFTPDKAIVSELENRSGTKVSKDMKSNEIK